MKKVGKTKVLNFGIKLFKRNSIITILKFLDEESTLLEDLKIILSVPPKRFIQAFFKRLF